MASRIAGITVEINGQTTGLQKSLESVNKSIKTTQSELKDVERLLKLDPKNTELVSQKQEKLAQNIKNTKEKLDALKNAQEQAKKQLESGDLGKDKYDALQREIIATEEELKKLAKEAADTNTALNKIDSVGKTVENVGNKMASVGSTLTATVTTPIVAGAVAAVNAYGDVDKQFQLVKQTMGTTANSAEDFQGLWDQMGKSAKNSVYGMQDAADATLNYARQGFSAKQATDMLTPAMSLAAGTGTDLSTVTAGLGNALKMFGADSSEAAGYADVLAKAQAQANTDTTQLFEAMSVAGPICKTVGWDIKDLATITDVFGNAGISGSEGANALKTGLARLASPAKSGAIAMDKLGLSTGQTYAIFNDNGTLKDMPTVIKNLNSAFSGLTDQEKLEAAANIFGKNQMSKWLTLIQSSPEEVSGLRSALDDCTGSADSMANALMSGTGGTIEQLKSTFDVLTVTIGEAVAPALQKVMEKAIDIMNAFMDLNPETQELILKIAGIAAAIGPVLLIGGKLTAGIGKALQKISDMGKGILNFVNQAKLGVGAGGKFASAIAAIGPAGWVVIGVVAALAAAFVHLWKNNEEFREKITEIWGGIKEKFSGAAQQITEAINSLGFDFDSLGEAIKAAWDWFCNALAPIVEGVIQAIATMLGGIIDIVTGIIQVICGIIKGFKDGDWTLFLDGLKNIWDGIWSILSAPVQAVIDIITSYLEKAGKTWGDVWNGVKEFFTNIWNGIRDFFVNLWNGIVSTVTGIVQGLSDFFTTIFTAIADFFKGIWQGISDFFTGIWEGISNTVTTVVTAISDFFTEKWTAISDFFTNLWNGIVDVVTTVWETIKNVVQVGLMFIGELISAAFQIITIPFRFIWENCKDTIIELWDAIKEKVSSALDAIKSVIETVWNGIKSFLEPIVDGIKTAIVTAWDAITTGVTNAVNAVKTVIETVWNAIVAFLSPIVDGIKNTVVTAWEAISSTLSGILDTISSFVSEKWNAIKDTVSSVVENIKSAVSEKWEAIKEKVSSVMDAVKQSISEKWEAAKEKVGSIVDTIKTNVGQKWDSIKEKVSTVSENIKSAISEKWTAAKDKVGSVVDTMKTNISTKFDSIKTAVGSKVDSIKSKMEQGWNNCLSTTTRIFGNIKSKIDSIMQGALNIVGNLISRIRSKFNFSWSLPRLKLPHISISGSFSINPPRVPHFSISWYKKAMENGMILNSPTIFGMKGSSLLAGGEAGSETVVGTESLLSMIKNAVASMSGGSTINYGGVNVNVYAAEGQDEMEIAQNVADIIKNQVGREAAVWA